MLTALGEHRKIMTLDSIGHISHADFASIYTVRQVLDFVPPTLSANCLCQAVWCVLTKMLHPRFVTARNRSSACGIGTQ